MLHHLNCGPIVNYVTMALAKCHISQLVIIISKVHIAPHKKEACSLSKAAKPPINKLTLETTWSPRHAQ